MTGSDTRVVAGRYRITGRIGAGGMGTVWRARDEMLGRVVAVKEILLTGGPGGEDIAAARDRVLREARAAAQVRHPAVVTIHDVVMEDDRPWIIMEHVDALPLSDRLARDGALSVAHTVRLGTVLVDALRAIHACGISHRDVKPANILLEDDGSPVLTDFGIATIEGDARLTATGLVAGTPGYTAPERLGGGPAGPPADLWSLGAVLYTAVEGRPPYDGATPAVIASAVLTSDAPPPPRRAGALGPLVLDLLARDPERRPTIDEVARRLGTAAGQVGGPPPATAAPGDEGRGTGIAAATHPATRVDPSAGQRAPGAGGDRDRHSLPTEAATRRATPGRAEPGPPAPPPRAPAPAAPDHPTRPTTAASRGTASPGGPAAPGGAKPAAPGPASGTPGRRPAYQDVPALRERPRRKTVRWLALAAGVAVSGVLVWSLVPDGGSGTGDGSTADPEQGQYSAPAPTLHAGDCINAAYDGSTWRPKSEPPEPLTCGSDPHTNYVVEKVGLAGQELDCHGPTRIKWQPPGSSEPLCLSRYLDNSPCLPVHETSSGRIDKALITVVAPCGSRPKIHGTTWHTRKVAYERTYPGVPESDCGHETPLVVVPEESVLCMSK